MPLFRKCLWVLAAVTIGLSWDPSAGIVHLSGAHASVCCSADFDHDGDVDGLDLKVYGSGQESAELSEVAEKFGRADCWIPTNYSGTYYTAIGPDPLFHLKITQTGADVTFTLEGQKMRFAGSGTSSCNEMALTCWVEGMGQLKFALTFGDQGQGFSGTWGFMSGAIDGTITGSRTPWPAYDIETHGIPYFIEADFIELGKIERVSRLRSGEGHDYSDDFESCRSMKHYYYPKSEGDTSVTVYSPVDGTVIGTTREYYESGGIYVYKGTLVGIVPDEHDAFWIDLFHIDLKPALAVGDRVKAGQALWRTGKTSGTVSEIAVWVRTPSGARLISFFQVMPDSVFQAYQARGMNSREEAIIARDERDADPLTCHGEEFQNGGNLENWVNLN